MKPQLIPKNADGPIPPHWVVKYSAEYLRGAPAEKLFRTIEEARAFIAKLEGGDK